MSFFVKGLVRVVGVRPPTRISYHRKECSSIHQYWSVRCGSEPEQNGWQGELAPAIMLVITSLVGLGIEPEGSSHGVQNRNVVFRVVLGLKRLFILAKRNKTFFRTKSKPRPFD